MTDARRLPGLAEAWDQLIDDATPGAVFRSGAWLVPWWSHFGAGKELCIYTARRNGRLVGVLPAYRLRTAFGYRQLRLMGDGLVGSDYLGVVAGRPDLQAVTEALSRALLTEEADLAFEGLTDDEPLITSVKAAARARRLPCAVQPLASCPVVRVPGDFQMWLRGRPHGAGAQLRRRLRWLERQSDFRIVMLQDERDIAESLPILWRLHAAAWARRGGSSVELGGAASTRFQWDSALALARRGWARLFLLYVAGAPRAALYGFEQAGWFAYYQSGYDPSWSRRSLGRVILGAALQHAFERGLSEFDFLRGDENYKWLFASKRRYVVRLRAALSVPAVPSCVLDQSWAGAKWLAREFLPPPSREWVHRQQRRLRRWTSARRLGGGPANPGWGGGEVRVQK